MHPTPAADLRDGPSLERAVAAAHPDQVYHLAAQSSVAASWDDPVHTGDVTGLGTARLLDAARHSAPAARVVVASSLEVFGEPERAPQNEFTPIHPASAYGAAKAYGHHLAHAYRQHAGFFVAVAILGNHESPHRPIAFVSRKIVRGAVTIARGDARELRLGNLDARRDWGFAADYVRAFASMARHWEADDFVVANGETRSVSDWCRLAFGWLGIDWREHVVTDSRFRRPEGRVPRVGDAAKARCLLGWCPSVGFEALVEMMIEAELARGGSGAG